MLKIGLLLLIVPSLVLMTFFFIDQSAVDACLSTGGSFNYALSECDLKEQHPFVPLMARYPLLVNGSMLLSVVGLVFCMKGLLWRPPQRSIND